MLEIRIFLKKEDWGERGMINKALEAVSKFSKKDGSEVGGTRIRSLTREEQH